jgi:hypothetical protein
MRNMLHTTSRFEPKRCEQTRLTIPECSCPRCWARMQAREDVRRISDTASNPVRHVIDAGIR